MTLRPMLLIPPLLFAAMAGLFLAGMMGDDGIEESQIVGRAAPEVPAEALGDHPGFDGSVFADGEVKIVNFWASWCPPCRAEHPALMDLAAAGVPIYGINKSDEGGDAEAFLAVLGNPYRAITVDPRGRASLGWGVIALPETFIVDGDGTVLLRFPGPIHGVMDSIILPELEAAGVRLPAS